MKLFERIGNSRISRRDFLKGSAVATAAIASLSLVGCSDNDVVSTTEGNAEGNNTDPSTESMPAHPEPTNRESEGTWISAACWHNCAGRCMNKVMVLDGMVIRQKTDDTHADSVEYPQQRSCLKGHSQQQQCFGADRLKYPMKRKHWEPLTGGKKELRGEDEWERITWDEAYKLIAAELKNCLEKYGSSSILVPGAYASGTDRMLNFLGGHTSAWDSISYGTFAQNMAALGLPYTNSSGNDRLDTKNAEYIVFEGANPAWNCFSAGFYALSEAHAGGTKIVVIGPSYNATALAMDAKWIPVYPGTDTALFLGIAHQMIVDDRVDYDFLNKYTVGFDADHMPADATTDENFKDYLMGKYDGVEKNAEWASKLTGATVEDIKFLADVLGKDHKTMLLHGWAPARINGGENVPQAIATVGWMGGHVGKSGHAISSVSMSRLDTGADLVNYGGGGLPAMPNKVMDVIPGPDAWNAVLTGEYTYVGDFYGAVGLISNGVKRKVDIHMIACDIDQNYLQTGPSLMKGIEAFRKVDFVMSRGLHMSTNCKYADIVLPVATRWEAEGGFGNTSREWVQVYTKVTEPLYEAKTDQEIDKGIIAAMGYDPLELYPLSEKAQFFNQIAGCFVVKEDAGSFETSASQTSTASSYTLGPDSYEPLVNITQADIDAWGVADEITAIGLPCQPQEGRISLDQFLADGGYQVARKDGDAFGHIDFENFIKDPEKNPVSSKSGKFEIYCQAKADFINNMGFSDLKVKPYANYFVPVTGYEQTFVDADITKEKGEYPYVMYNPHYVARVHSTLDNNRWLQETFADPMYISTADAKEKGIKTGDTVLVWNQYGKILRRASVMPNMMPGVVSIPHGSNLNLDHKTGIDHGGADNTLVGTPAYGMGATGYNNNNCNFKKYDGEPLALRHEIPQIVFED